MTCAHIKQFLPRQPTELLQVMSGTDEAFGLMLPVIDMEDEAARCLVMGCALNAALHKRGVRGALPIGVSIARLNAALETRSRVVRTDDDLKACRGNYLLFARLLRRLHHAQICIPVEDLEGLFDGDQDSRTAYFKRAFEGLPP
ncbi:hypothetical protein [Phenylobacterium sp.]|uniref:hypothetical protein n=1 Tax=Phenylobacterium sp. TaxID=1871053 RepID=UPI00301E2B33